MYNEMDLRITKAIKENSPQLSHANREIIKAKTKEHLVKRHIISLTKLYLITLDKNGHIPKCRASLEAQKIGFLKC